MTKLDVLAGIVAANEWNVQHNVRIVFVPDQSDYYVATDRETISLQRWTNGKDCIALGYGPKSRTLVIHMPPG